MPKSTVRVGKHKTGHRAEGNQMSTVDRCFSRTWNTRDHITAEYVSDDMWFQIIIWGGKSLLSKDMMVVNGGTELGRDKGGR